MCLLFLEEDASGWQERWCLHQNFRPLHDKMMFHRPIGESEQKRLRSNSTTPRSDELPALRPHLYDQPMGFDSHSTSLTSFPGVPVDPTSLATPKPEFRCRLRHQSDNRSKPGGVSSIVFMPHADERDTRRVQFATKLKGWHKPYGCLAVRQMPSKVLGNVGKLRGEQRKPD